MSCRGAGRPGVTLAGRGEGKFLGLFELGVGWGVWGTWLGWFWGGCGVGGEIGLMGFARKIGFVSPRTCGYRNREPRLGF
jgi:hypothetical protein